MRRYTGRRARRDGGGGGAATERRECLGASFLKNFSRIKSRTYAPHYPGPFGSGNLLNMGLDAHKSLQLPHFQERGILLPEDTQLIMDRVRQQDPQLFEMHETELRAYFREKKHTIPATIGMLRIQFWREYDRVQGGQMIVANIYRDIASSSHWAQAIRNVNHLAWILTPLASMIAQCDERIDTLMSNMRDVVAISPVDRSGNVDRHLAKLQFEMLMYFDQRKHGAIVQRVEQKTTSTSVNATITQNIPADSKKIADMMEMMRQRT